VLHVLLFLMLAAFGSGCAVIELDEKLGKQEKIIDQQQRMIDEFQNSEHLKQKETDANKKTIENLQFLVKEKISEVATMKEASKELEKQKSLVEDLILQIEAMSKAFEALKREKKIMVSQKRALEKRFAKIKLLRRSRTGGVPLFPGGSYEFGEENGYQGVYNSLLVKECKRSK